MIDPRAIALQGIGYAAALIALQGLAPLQADRPLEVLPGFTAAAAPAQFLAMAAPSPSAAAGRVERTGLGIASPAAEKPRQRAATRRGGGDAAQAGDYQVQTAKATRTIRARAKGDGRTAKG